jgi:hypothetical protein
MNSRITPPDGKEEGPARHDRFGRLRLFFDRYGSGAAELSATFLSLAGNGPRITSSMVPGLTSVYEDAAALLEADAVRGDYPSDVLELQQGLYRELEDILCLGDDERHHFLVVVPVADRPLLLEGCIASLLEQCRIFGYGGVLKDAAGAERFRKITLFIVDDSQGADNIRRTRELTESAKRAGLAVHYIGLAEQRETLLRLPPEMRERLSGAIGPFGDVLPPHKGASITRNIAYFRLLLFLRDFPERALVYFLDSDEEFLVQVKDADCAREVPFINYFYWLDRIFRSSDAEVLTGKVVGDPPVSPSVMVRTFLQDLIAFFDSASRSAPEEDCGFHGLGGPQTFSAAYHDMARLYGYKETASDAGRLCSLEGRHTVGDCFDDLSRKALAFFHGLHPTRPQFYIHRGSFLDVEAARTVYTGNYVLNKAGLRHFVPFARMKLRMAGPALGRILKQKLGARFVSGNLPLLHKRVDRETYAAEFRSGIAQTEDSVNILDEFRRQFWGDVMLFSVERLAATGYPTMPASAEAVETTVGDVLAMMRNLYLERQAQVDRLIIRLRAHLSSPGRWWNTAMPASRERFERFCSLAEENFGASSGGMSKISEEVADGVYARMIIDGIQAFYSDEASWNEAVTLLTRRNKG